MSDTTASSGEVRGEPAAVVLGAAAGTVKAEETEQSRERKRAKRETGNLMDLHMVELESFGEKLGLLERAAADAGGALIPLRLPLPSASTYRHQRVGGALCLDDRRRTHSSLCAQP